MYDIWVFCGFVSIVLSPCFVALLARARADHEEIARAPRLTRAVPPRTGQPRTAASRRIVSPAAAVPIPRELARQPAFTRRPKLLRDSLAPRGPLQIFPRNRVPQPSSLFLAPMKRGAVTRSVRSRRLGGFGSAATAARRLKERTVCIHPVRRTFAARATDGNNVRLAL